jgi:Ca2+-binding RTX toxin-like protein
VISNATNGNNVIDVLGAAASVSVVGLHAQIDVNNSESATDSLAVNGLGGDDSITATTLAEGVTKLTIDGGAGNDTILGSQGADVLLGGEGNDFILGDGGNDVAYLGAGDDVFQWNPGDGNDTVEGQDGTDTLRFFGANISENIDIAANGGRALFFRNVANVTMDLKDVERIDFRALGGADNIVVGDLTGTDVTRVDIDLAGPNGGGDGAADTVTVNASQGADVFSAFGDASGVGVLGLQAQTNILSQEVAIDRLTLNALGGDDVIDATNLKANSMPLTVNGGLGADRFLGSEGNDLFNGGDGNDVSLLGAGDDVAVWNPGDDNDTVDGQAGFDTLLFNGANIAENIDVSAVGDHVRFSRDVASVTMDLNDLERIDFTARGGADTVVVNDLSGTDVAEVNIDLGAAGAGGDGAADTIVINATGGDDVIIVNGDGSGISVLGLAAQVNITNFDPTIDRLVINSLAGDDVIEASGVTTGSIQLTLSGGDGSDVLIGGAGDDVLHGDAGDDVLIGGPGNDVLDAAPGDDIVIQLVPDSSLELFGNSASIQWLTAHHGEYLM